MSDTRKLSVKSAVFLTLLSLAAIAALVAMPFVVGEPSEEMASQWGRFLGRFHPLVLHLPIGMLALVLLMEFGKVFRKPKGSSTLGPAFLTALSAIVAVVFGFLLYLSDPGGYPEELIESHLWWGTGFAVAILFTLIVKSWIDVAGGRGNWIYILLLLASGGVMTVASHDGGSITHGANFLTDEAPNEVRELYNRVVPEDRRLEMLAGEKESETVVVPLEERVVYEHWIQPIFDQKCVSCHGPDKQKGDLRMDTYEALLVGGEEGGAIKPGNAFDSNMIFRIDLPVSDDEHMPPEGKKQMAEHEIKVLNWWIDAGASPDAKVADAGVPEEIMEAASQLVPPEVLAAEQEAEKEAESRQEAARRKLEPFVADLQETFPAAINFESRSSDGLVFTAVSMRDKFGDRDLAELEPVVPGLVSVDLSATKVTDEGLGILAGAEKLRMLRLAETDVTDAGLETIARMSALESLNLYGTAVTTEGVRKLAELPNLKRLYLWQTPVDEAGAEALREAMPDCEIILGMEVGTG